MRKFIFALPLLFVPLALVKCVGDAPALPDAGGGNDSSVDTGTGSDGQVADTGVMDGGAGDADAGCVIPNTGMAGTIDNGFPGGPKVIPGDFDPNAAAVDSVGNIYLVGTISNSNNCSMGAGNDIGVLRFTPGGSIDATFNPGNKARCFHFDNSDSAYAAAVDRKDNLVVGALAYHTNTWHAALVRVKTSGGMIGQGDPTFSANGKLDLGTQFMTYPQLAGWGAVHGIAFDSSDRIIAVGSTGGQFDAQTKGYAIRLGNDGQVDATFASGGFGGGNFNGFYQVAVDAMDRPIVSATGSLKRMAILRFTVAGGADNSFGIQPGVTAFTNDGGADNLLGSVVLANGNIHAIGDRNATSNFGDIVTGVMDPSGMNAVEYKPVGKENDSFSKHVIGSLCGQQVIIAGVNDNVNQKVIVGRLLPNGSLDTGFGNNGYYTSNFNGVAVPIGVMQDPITKKIIVAARNGMGSAILFRVNP